MNEWNVIEVFVVVAGLFISVGMPIIRLNSTITKLNTNVEGLDRRFGKFENDNSNSHKRIWGKNNEQDDTLKDHETRITVLENDKTKNM